MQPDGGSRPLRRREKVVPRRSHGGDVDDVRDRVDAFEHHRGAITQWNAAKRVRGRIRRRRLVQRGHEPTERRGRIPRVGQRRLLRDDARQPSAHSPRPRVAIAGVAAPDRRRYRQGQRRREHGKPLQFVLHERRRDRASGKSYDEFVAESVDDVVPSGCHERERKRREVGHLLLQQRSDEWFVDVDFGLGSVA